MLAVGLVGESATTVDVVKLASTLGSGGLEVFSTPSLIALMENAARCAVEPLLPADRSTVGVRVDVRHLAPSPPGEQVRARAELIEVDGRRLVFRFGCGAQQTINIGPSRTGILRSRLHIFFIADRLLSCAFIFCRARNARTLIAAVPRPVIL